MAVKIKQQKHASKRLQSRLKRQVRGRKKLSGTPERPRLVVTRSSKHITVQVVDDLIGKTLAEDMDLRLGQTVRLQSSVGIEALLTVTGIYEIGAGRTAVRPLLASRQRAPCLRCRRG